MNKWIKIYALALTAVALFFAGKRIWFQKTVMNIEPPQYWREKRDIYRANPVQPGNIIFIGDSHIERSPFAEQLRIINRGIAGETTTQLLSRLQDVIDQKPSVILLLTGINDIRQGETLKLPGNFDAIFTRLKGIKLLVSPVMPVNSRYPNAAVINVGVMQINGYIKSQQVKYGYEIIPGFDSLPDSLTLDNLHLNGRGYRLWLEKIKGYF